MLRNLMLRNLLSPHSADVHVMSFRISAYAQYQVTLITRKSQQMSAWRRIGLNITRCGDWPTSCMIRRPNPFPLRALPAPDRARSWT